MTRSKRTFTNTDKDLIFNLWKQGTGFSDIGRIMRLHQGLSLLYFVKLAVLNHLKGVEILST